MTGSVPILGLFVFDELTVTEKNHASQATMTLVG
jgi:hypothetical protein